MKCRIIKSSLLQDPLHTFSCNLPMFSDEFVVRNGEVSEYIALFTKPDRYSLYDIYVCPHKIDSKRVNEAWNYCIENNVDEYEFEMIELPEYHIKIIE